MASSRYLARAKVNLGVRITGVRADGYHLIESLLVSIDLHDVVTVSSALDPAMSRVPTVSVVGPAAGGVPVDESNIAVRAAAGAAVHIDIDKRIPHGAGLGGGSADAAAVLTALGQDDDVSGALALGADVPFCLRGGAAIVRGIGELIESVPMSRVDDLALVLVVPAGVHVPTVAVYRRFDDVGAGDEESIEVPGLGPVRNDLQAAAFSVAPELAVAAQELTRSAGRPWLMTGSGSGLLLPLADPVEAGEVAREVGGLVVTPVEHGVSPAPLATDG